MASFDNKASFPTHASVVNNIACLKLDTSASKLHGIMCGYLCAGALEAGEMYLRALMKKNSVTRIATLTLFELYTISQQQISTFDFEFKLLLPADSVPLGERAQAFSEWCNGFMQGMHFAGITYEDFKEQEAKDALNHITEFAQLDYQTLDVDESDEKALLEVSEYTRLAILHLKGDLQDPVDTIAH